MPLDMSDITGEGGEVLKEGDIVPSKAGTDLQFVLPEAVARGADLASRFRVDIRTAKGVTAIEASGPWRLWRSSTGAIRRTEPRPARSVPLRFSVSFGGGGLIHGHSDVDVDERNPLGRGRACLTGAVDEEPGPQAWWHDAPFEVDMGLANQPAGLTPLGRSWQGRRHFARTYDEGWKRNRCPFLPADFRVDFFNAVHPRLRLTHADALAPIRVEGMSDQPFEFALSSGRLLVVRNLDDASLPTLLAPIDTILRSPLTRRIDTLWRVQTPLDWLGRNVGVRPLGGRCAHG